MVGSPKSGNLRYISCIINTNGAHALSPSIFLYAQTFAVATFCDIDQQKQSRVKKLEAQTQHGVIQPFLPPYIEAVSDDVREGQRRGFNSIGQSISGSTGY